MRYWVFAVLLLSTVHAAYIYGDIYSSEDMQKLNNTVIKIRGEDFSYYFVADKSNYSVQLPDGRYDITAEHYSDGELVYRTSENLYLSGENVRLDLVLGRPAENLMLLIAGGLVVLAVIVFGMAKRIEKAPLREEVPKGPDKDSEKVLEVLAANENRMTQKELKQVLNYSDSKISLVLSELEHEGFIKRFKRGRGNIIKRIS